MGKIKPDISVFRIITETRGTLFGHLLLGIEEEENPSFKEERFRATIVNGANQREIDLLRQNPGIKKVYPNDECHIGFHHVTITIPPLSDEESFGDYCRRVIGIVAETLQKGSNYRYHIREN